MAKSKALVKAEGKLKQLQKAVKAAETRVKLLLAKDAKAEALLKKKAAKKKTTSKKKTSGKKKVALKKKTVAKKKPAARKKRPKKGLLVQLTPVITQVS